MLLLKLIEKKDLFNFIILKNCGKTKKILKRKIVPDLHADFNWPNYAN